MITQVGWTGRKVRLRAVESADHQTLIGFDRDGDPGVGGYRHWAAHRAADDFHLAIETLRGRILVGSLWVQTDPASGRFSYGIGIGARHRRCGYAGDAVAVLLTQMFGLWCYRKCEVSVHGGNFASLSMHGGLGFREEGRPRDTELRYGEIRYPVLMGITADQFAARHQTLATAGPLRGRHWRTRQRGRHWRVAQTTTSR